MNSLFVCVVLCSSSSTETELTVRALASAISRWDAKTAAELIDGVKPSQKLITEWSKLHRTPMPIRIQDYSDQVNGARATASFTSFIPGGPIRGVRESLRLIRRENHWRIVPPKPTTDPSASLSLSSLAGLIAHFDAVTDTSAATCAESIRVCASKLIQSFSTHEGKVDWPDSGWEQICGDLTKCLNGETYAINLDIKGKLLNDLKKPQEIVLLYEGKNKTLTFRHSGKAMVALLDGVVRAVDKSAARKLRWK